MILHILIALAAGMIGYGIGKKQGAKPADDGGPGPGKQTK